MAIIFENVISWMVCKDTFKIRIFLDKSISWGRAILNANL